MEWKNVNYSIVWRKTNKIICNNCRFQFLLFFDVNLFTEPSNNAAKIRNSSRRLQCSWTIVSMAHHIHTIKNRPPQDIRQSKWFAAHFGRSRRVRHLLQSHRRPFIRSQLICQRRIHRTIRRSLRIQTNGSFPFQPLQWVIITWQQVFLVAHWRIVLCVYIIRRLFKRYVVVRLFVVSFVNANLSEDLKTTSRDMGCVYGDQWSIQVANAWLTTNKSFNIQLK